MGIPEEQKFYARRYAKAIMVLGGLLLFLLMFIDVIFEIDVTRMTPCFLFIFLVGMFKHKVVCVRLGSDFISAKATPLTSAHVMLLNEILSVAVLPKNILEISYRPHTSPSHSKPSVAKVYLGEFLPAEKTRLLKCLQERIPPEIFNG